MIQAVFNKFKKNRKILLLIYRIVYQHTDQEEKIKMILSNQKQKPHLILHNENYLMFMINTLNVAVVYQISPKKILINS